MWAKDGTCSVCGKEIPTNMDFTKHLGANPKCRTQSQVVHATESGSRSEDIKTTHDLWIED